jgi:hypothetical protein
LDNGDRRRDSSGPQADIGIRKIGFNRGKLIKTNRKIDKIDKIGILPTRKVLTN